MRIFILFILSVLLFSTPARSNTGRLRVNVHHFGSGDTRSRTGPSSYTSRTTRPGFPFHEGSIGEPLTNPLPRMPEKLTACMYGADGVLLYEREGKNCDYRYVSTYQRRVEVRKKEAAAK